MTATDIQRVGDALASPLGSVCEFPPSTTYQAVGDAVVAWTFASYEDDYRAIRDGVGVIDQSGAGLVAVDGPGAEAVILECVTRDVAYMTPERSLMGLVLRDDGKPVSVVTVFRTPTGYLLMTSTGSAGAVEALVAERAGGRATVGDARARFAAVGIEGPGAVDVLGDILDESLEGLPFQAVRATPWDGEQLTVSRVGLTGEFGFTFIVSWERAPSLWRALCERGTPAGGEALETAMLEIRQPVLGRELFADDTVITAGLNWLVDIQRDGFAGREAILAELEAGAGSGRISVRSSQPLHRGLTLAMDGAPVGDVAHGVRSPSLGEYCGIARVDRAVLAAGLDFDLVDVDGRSIGVARSVSSPVVVPTSWASLQG